MKPAEIDHEELLEAALAIRGAVEGDRFRFCSKGGGSFLESGGGQTRLLAGLHLRGGRFDLLLPYSSFHKLAKLFSGPVSAWQEENQFFLEEGGRRVSLFCEEVTEGDPGPRWSAPKEILESDGQKFRSALQDALRAASRDPGRPVLRTVALTEEEGQLYLVATDSFRLLALPLQGKMTNPLPRTILLPRDMAKSLAGDLQRRKPEEVFLEYGEEEGYHGATIAYGSTAWHFVSPEGNYPDWQDLLRSSGDTLEISRDEVQSLLRFVEALAGKGKPEQNGSVALRMELGEEVRVLFQRPGLGEVSQTLEKASWPGEKTTLGVNPLFLADMLDVLRGETLRGQMSDSGGIVFSGRGKTKYLLMPVRLSELV